MELINYLTIALIIIILGFLIGMAGLRYPPKISIPNRQSDGQPGNLSTGKPPVCLELFLINNFGNSLPHPRTLTAWGRGKILTSSIPLLGRLWIPLTWTLDMAPGTDFVLHINLTWFGRVFIRGGDELRAGHGRFLLGEQSLENENLERSERTLLWIYSLWLSPFSLINDEHIQWQVGNGNAIRAEIKFDNETIQDFSLTYDAQKFHLLCLDTTRTTSKEGKELPFHAEFSQHRYYDNNMTFPAHISLKWEGEKAYLNLDLTGLRFDVDISEMVNRGLD